MTYNLTNDGTHPLFIHRDCSTLHHVLQGRVYSIPECWDAAKDLPIYDVPLVALDTTYSYTLDLRQFASHVAAVLDADLDRPIILDDRGLLIDGGHRIVKSILVNRATIKVVRFLVTPPHTKVDE